jgi:hypothetical protein
MASIKLNPEHRDIDALHGRIRTIEEQLSAHQRISPQIKELLFQELEGTQQALYALRAKAVSLSQYGRSKVTSFETTQNTKDIEELDQLKDKIITLYGNIDTRATDSEIEEIKDETYHLQQMIKTGNPQEIAKDVSILSKHISTFCEGHQVSRKDRQVIVLAKQSLKTADTILRQKVIGQTVNQFNILSLLQTEIEKVEEDEELEPTVMELFNVAELFYRFKLNEAKRAFNQLPESIKSKVRHHLSILENGIDIEKNLIKSVQALIATANEISQSDEEYLTIDEIHEMYKEISSLQNKETVSNLGLQVLPKHFWLQA